MIKYYFKTAALVVLLLGASTAVQAETEWVVYKPGVVKAAVAEGDTVLLGYLSTW
tara:strand:+ start:2803 stop:2967 length:165 start_codon:yes stop_codon:yes gene_type:complete